MSIKALAIGITSLFAVSGATCGKSTTDDVTKDKPAVAEVQLEGVDTGVLTPREKREWSTYVSELLSPCPSVPVPIAQCVKEKRDCAKCMPAAKYILRGVKDGLTREQIEKSYKNRFDADKVQSVPIDDSPVKGSEGAPITIIEFADFECPHCAEVAPLIDKVVDARKDEVRFAFKFYPLPSHPHAEIAARAGVAAHRQGKFWEMHHEMFASRGRLEQTDLDSYAKKIGLDLSRFHADMQSPETTAKIERDKKLGEDLQIGGTPTIFINGRLYDGHQDMNEWLDLELATMPGGGKGAAAPAAKDGGADAGKAPAAPSDAGKAVAAPADAGKAAAAPADAGKATAK